MTKTIKILGYLGNFLNIISIAALIFMMLIVVADIIMRTVFASPIVGATEMVRMAMVCMVPTFVSALLDGCHVRVGILVDNIGRKGQLIFDTFGYITTAIICALISYQSYVEMKFAINYMEVYSMLRIPKWPFQLIFSISFAIMVPAIIALLILKFIDKDAYKINETEEGVEAVE
ncbi:TRAP transporter small permease [Alkalibaculum sporogenes]|nr:TRAP transporter small permease [Alkalibaculum sporogenes]